MTSNYSRGPGDVGAGGQQGAGGLPGQAAKRGRGPVPSPKSLMENGLSLVATGKSVVVGCAPSSSHAPVAQLDRVPGYEPGGREFESLRARHYWNEKAQSTSSLTGPFHSNSAAPRASFVVRVATTRWWSVSSTTRARRSGKRYRSPRVEPTRVACWALSRQARNDRASMPDPAKGEPA